MDAYTGPDRRRGDRKIPPDATSIDQKTARLMMHLGLLRRLLLETQLHINPISIGHHNDGQAS